MNLQALVKEKYDNEVVASKTNFKLKFKGTFEDDEIKDEAKMKIEIHELKAGSEYLFVATKINGSTLAFTKIFE